MLPEGALRKLPEGARTLVEQVHLDLVHLHTKWKLFQQLYLASDVRTRLLADVAPYFFWELRNLLVEDLARKLHHLVEPAGPRSFLKLLLQLETHVQPEVSQRLEEDLAETLRLCEILNDWQRKFAHKPLRLMDDPGEMPYLNREVFEETLHLMAGLLNRVLIAFEIQPIRRFEVDIPGDANDLVQAIAHGYAALSFDLAGMDSPAFEEAKKGRRANPDQPHSVE